MRKDFERTVQRGGRRRNGKGNGREGEQQDAELESGSWGELGWADLWCAVANCGGVTLITQQQMELQERHQVMRYMAAWCDDHQMARYFHFWGW